MILFLFAFLIFVPILAGYPVRKILEPGGKGLLDTGLLGVLTLLMTSGGVQLVLLLLKRSFSEYEKIYPLLLCVLSLTGLLLLALDIKNHRGTQKLSERLKGFYRSWFQSRGALVFCVLTVITVLLCFVRICAGAPDISNDFTLETIRTTLGTDTIYRYHSLTGQEIAEGMPIRQQILTLPFFLAFLSDVFHVEAAFLTYKLFPCYVLLLTMAVYGSWSSLLFPKQREKQIGFLLLVSVLILVGDYANMAPAALLLHQGFTGNALFAGVVLPFAMYLCMKKKWIMALSCVGAEVFLIWTTYGLGFSVLVLLLSALLQLRRKQPRRE